MEKQSLRPPGQRSRRRSAKHKVQAVPRQVDYRQVVNTLAPTEVFSADEIESIHDAALRVLEELGIRVLLDDGRARFRAAGADVDDTSMMVRIDRGLVRLALETAPSDFHMFGGESGRNIRFGANSLVFGAGAGCPNITDIDRGRRAGTIEDFIAFTKLQQSFDIIGKLAPSIEPQDVPVHLRHYAMTRAQLTLSDKVPFVFSRGTDQVVDGFHMCRLARGLSEEKFRERAYIATVINTNSPRQLDRPMAQGIIDFAEWGQVTIITPFCLSGAMAPITISGALTLSHAEALAGITLAQIASPGAPVVYGAFSSNVDMKSGAPVFGTPEHIKTNFGAGQLARHVGLPWRSASGTASNAPDVQADYETQLSLWGAVLGGANLIYHAAGWLEGGLTISLEKFVTDLEALQTLAEVMYPVPCDSGDIGFDAIAEVAPGGHFFAATHTMSRYRTQFYEPLVSDWSNFGQWNETGAVTATQRANRIWKQTLEAFEPPPIEPSCLEALDEFIMRRTKEGGAPQE